MNVNRKRKKLAWSIISPWLIVGAIVTLAPVFLIMTVENINQQKEQTTRLLVEKGAALIHSFEAGARAGIGLPRGGFHLQKLLMEIAKQSDIDYIIITDTFGTILADSDPLRIGTIYGRDLDLPKIAEAQKPVWRQAANSEGADTFEVYRRFAPTGNPVPGFPDPRLMDQTTGSISVSRGLIIFIGLNMGPITAAHEQDLRSTILMALLFLIIGCAGIILLLLAQGYRTVRTSLSRIRAFSDSLVDNMPIGLVATDDGGKLIAFNQTAEKILSQTAGEVIGRPAEDVLPSSCRELLKTLAVEQRIIEREFNCATAEGRMVPLDVIATMLYAEDSAFVGHVVLFRDMTEIRRLEEEIARGRRLASLGNLAAGIAHEIRNPLSTIKGFATCFLERFRNNPEDRETAEVMIREVDRLNRVITQLLDFARPFEMNRVLTSLQAVARHALKMVEDEARRKGVILNTDFTTEVDDIPLDADRMTQVFLNLFLNALLAMENGGVLGISTALQDERFIRITVTDTGVGIPEENLHRVFDPYFTTRPSGTGLGLAIVHKIIESHGGEIRLESDLGKGTTVIMLMPKNIQEEGASLS